jgi:tripartite-type tricarboxylate transporter receptor subunit TctC
MAKTFSRDKGLELDSSISRLVPHIAARRVRWPKKAKMIPRIALLLAIALCNLPCDLIQPAAAQTFPDRYLRFVVPFPPGGATDVLGRILAKRMSEILGQPVVVENHGGAGGTIGVDFASRQPADGYTVVLVSALAHIASKKLYSNLRYDPITSFTSLGSLGALSYVLVVNPAFPANDLDSFIKAVRSAPGKYNYASAGVGSAPHLAMELFLRAANVNIVHVPFQGSGPALTAVIAGDVQTAIDNIAALPLIKAGKLRALAQTGKRRSAHLPEVPTFAEAGLDKFDVTANWGLLAPAGVPERVVAILNNALVRAVSDPAVRETLLAQGISPEPGSPEQFRAALVSESDKWSKLIDEAKIQP